MNAAHHFIDEPKKSYAHTLNQNLYIPAIFNLLMSNQLSKDTPLNEVILRKYERPSLNDRELVRKLCLSVGLLQPGDSRDVIVDVLYVLLKEKKEINSEEVRDKVIQLRKEKNLQLLGIASSNIRRQLKRLRDIYLIEKINNNYRITENENLSIIFEEKIEKFLLPAITSRIKEYLEAVHKEFR